MHGSRELSSVPLLFGNACTLRWVIDIGGNNLRLIAFIEFRDNRMYVKHIVTHSEYDKLCRRYAKEVE